MIGQCAVTLWGFQLFTNLPYSEHKATQRIIDDEEIFDKCILWLSAGVKAMYVSDYLRLHILYENGS